MYDKYAGIIAVYERLESFPFNDFESYVNNIFSEGVIFSEKVAKQMSNFSVKPKYDCSSWLLQKYKHWKNEVQFCTIEQGLNLFVGLFQSKHILDLRNCRTEIVYWGRLDCAYKKSDYGGEEVIGIEELLENDILSGEAKFQKFEMNGESKFLIKELFEWLLIRFPRFKPNDALLEVFELENEINSTESKNPKAEIKKIVKKEEHEDIECEDDKGINKTLTPYPARRGIHKCLDEAIRSFYAENKSLPDHMQSYNRLKKIYTNESFSIENKDCILFMDNCTLTWKPTAGKIPGESVTIQRKAIVQYARDTILPHYKAQLEV